MCLGEGSQSRAEVLQWEVKTEEAEGDHGLVGSQSMWFGACIFIPGVMISHLEGKRRD